MSADAPPHISLGDLAEHLDARLVGDSQVLVRGIHQDSRRIEPGDLFVARRGDNTDGLSFVQPAAKQGAAAILVEQGHIPNDPPVPMLVVPNIRTGIGQAASMLYGDPTSKLTVIGITGTNGKTTTSHLLASAINAAGGRTGLLGTLGTFFEDLHFDTGHTTPEADEIMRRCKQMVDHGATHLVMEVSSHALALGRADAVQFDVAALTNLTQDHLDFHHTIEAYGDAKRRLFFDLSPTHAVVMIDDEFGRGLYADLAERAVVSVSRHAEATTADIHPVAPIVLDASGIQCRIHTPAGDNRLHASLVGEHNLANLLLAVGITHALELPLDRVLQGLAGTPSVPGRMQRCDTTLDDISVVVDYAHTPDALQRALSALRPITSGRLWCVFGCGGDRDKEKRPLMGRVVAHLADEAIVTNDNPRSEAPEVIAEAILAGMTGGTARVQQQLDRAAAIERAVAHAEPGDVVLVAGKGHEPYQLVGDNVLAFDDREQAARALAIRRTGKE